MGRRLVVVVVAMVGLALPATAVGAAAPDDLVCGQTITTSVKLRADLTCSGVGLIIAAGGVTVNLAGHSITSTDGTGAGIRLVMTDPRGPCVADVAVRGGTVSGFFAGIDTSNCGSESPGRVSAMTLTDNTWGMRVGFGYDLSLDRTTIVGPNGIFANGRFEVTGSRIHITSPTGSSVTNRFGQGSTLDSSRLEGGQILASANIRVSKSHLTDVTVDCVDAEMDISDNRFTGGGIVDGQACGFRLHRNRFIGPGSGTAADLRGAFFGGDVTDNVFTGWDTALRVDDTPKATITGNTFRRNGVGVVCEIGGCGGTVSGNTFADNTGTGLLLRSGIWNIGSNTALRNGGLGIDAQGPELTVLDDGGNIARRNLAPECIGVVCTPHP